MRQILQLVTSTAVAIVLEDGGTYAVRCVWPRPSCFQLPVLVKGIRGQHKALKLARSLARRASTPAGVEIILEDWTDPHAQQTTPASGDPIEQPGICSP